MTARKRKSGEKNLKLKIISIVFLVLIFGGLILNFTWLSPRIMNVEAVFDKVSLYPSGGSLRLCLVFNVTNPKSSVARITAIIDLNKVNLGNQSIYISNVLGVYDQQEEKMLQYTTKDDHIIQVTLELNANEERSLIVLL